MARAIDEAAQAQAATKGADQAIKRKSSAGKVQARQQLIHIYKENNPKMIEKVDEVMAKYVGKEEELLQAVRTKYDCPEDWSFVLKHYSHSNNIDRKKAQKRNWNIDDSLKPIRKVLDDLARGIGGEVVDAVAKDGHRALVVRRGTRSKSYRMKQVKSTVRTMQEELVHLRFRDEVQVPYLTEEHERRAAEKERSQSRKNAATQHSRKKRGDG